jgi:hypothetical protein
VRIAPDEVSCSEPEAMKIIYAVNSGYFKVRGVVYSLFPQPELCWESEFISILECFGSGKRSTRYSTTSRNINRLSKNSQ